MHACMMVFTQIISMGSLPCIVDLVYVYVYVCVYVCVCVGGGGYNSNVG